MRSLAALLLVLASLSACNEKQKRCEHARDVYVANAERRSKEALAGVATEYRARVAQAAKADIDKANTGFVKHCLALDDHGQECIARIDELEKADIDERAAIEACPADEHGFPDAGCRDKAKAERKKIVGPCEDALATITAKIYPNPNKPTSPDVIDLEVVPR